MAASLATPIDLVVDASVAPAQSIVRTHETIPVAPGPLTLYYPQWISGEHAASGPIQNVAALAFRANGAELAWRRDAENMYAFHLDVPAGVTQLQADFTYLGAPFGEYSSNRLASGNMFVIDWNQNVLYPAGMASNTILVNPTLLLPSSAWRYATALYDPRQSGARVSWSATPLNRLLDSPLDACTNFRAWTLWRDAGSFPGAATFNVCADIPEELDASERTIGHFRTLVKEMLAMYGARHWYNYHFLLTVSDVLPGEGVEHHESSDDGEGGDYLIDRQALERGGDLLSHEFNHSWDGKYRMPDGLVRSDFNTPYDDSLLWVYEGMTQYYGDVMSFRDGIRDASDWPDHVAALYANYDQRPGRLWRSLADTATSAPFLYGAPRGYGSERRSVDFYGEGELLWLRADAVIRQLSGGKRSLDTFARAFFGGQNTGPITVPYDRAQVIAGLNRVQPYDWSGFFHTYVDAIAPHPPDGFTPDGWRLVYTGRPSHDVRAGNYMFSAGFTVANGTVTDVRFGSPAWRAGLGFGYRLVAVNGRAYSNTIFDDALREAQSSARPIAIIATKDQLYRTISIAYDGGPRYPHLVRVAGAPDRLSEIVKPL